MYQRLSAALAELGETNFQIQSAYILKIGCVPLLIPEDPVSSTIISIEKEQTKLYFESQNKIIEALEKHPNVFDITVLDLGDFGHITPLRNGSLVQGKTFSLRVNLPARLQRFPFGRLQGKKPIEQFEVVSHGCLYTAFAPIQDYPMYTNIGHEYRELLRTQIEKETDFKSPMLGPSPIHPDFYFVCLKRGNEESPVGMSIHSIKDDVFLVFDGETQLDQDFVTLFLHEITSPMFDFYLVQSIRSALLNCHVEILNDFSDLSDSIKELSAARWWRFLKSLKLTRMGRNYLTRIHTRIVEFEDETFDLLRQRNQLLEEIKQKEVLFNIFGYFHKQTEPDVEIPKTLSPALQFFEGELQTFSNIWSVAIATLLGAGFGAILTALLSEVWTTP